MGGPTMASHGTEWVSVFQYEKLNKEPNEKGKKFN
jgi:hypothetical protein